MQAAQIVAVMSLGQRVVFWQRGGTYADMHPLVTYCPHFGGAVGVKQVGQSVSSLRYSTMGAVCAG